MPGKTTWSLLLVLLFLMPGLGAAPGHAAPVYVLLTTIPVPPGAGNVQNGAFTGYDIAYFDGTTQLWAGDGPSLLKGFDLTLPGSPPLSGTPINTGASPATRVDEMAFDPKDHLLLVANNAADPPFATLVDTSTKAIVTKITFDGKTVAQVGDGH